MKRTHVHDTRGIVYISPSVHVGNDGMMAWLRSSDAAQYCLLCTDLYSFSLGVWHAVSYISRGDQVKVIRKHCVDARSSNGHIVARLTRPSEMHLLELRNAVTTIKHGARNPNTDCVQSVQHSIISQRAVDMSYQCIQSGSYNLPLAAPVSQEQLDFLTVYWAQANKNPKHDRNKRTCPTKQRSPAIACNPFRDKVN